MRTIRFSILALLLFACAKASACSVPVFRYALNYWEADGYELAADQVKLSPDITVNLAVKPADGDTAKLMLGDEQIWAGQMTPEAMDRLLDSPIRREIVKRIVNGDSIVWVLVDSGDAKADNTAEKALTERLQYLESIAILPQIIPNDPFNKLGPGPDLTLRYSVLRISRKNAAEEFTLAMLRHGDDDNQVPTAYPVFGRGRVLIALPQEKLTPDNIDEVCGFITGQCSCEVKDSRMGWDLLIKCDWDDELEQADQRRQNEPDQQPPGKRSIASGPATRPVAEPNMEPQTVVFHGQPSQATIVLPQEALPMLSRKLAVGAVALLLTAILAVLWLRKRA